MPHQCTDCGRTFEDGSKQMLSGCPDCGGNKFQFRPSADGDPPDPSEDSDEAAPPDPPVGGTLARTVGGAATAVRDVVGRSDDAVPVNPEDAAQATARSDVVPADELPDPADEEDDDGSSPAGDSGPGPDETEAGSAAEDDDRPDLADLRAELNDQFESIRVLEPGQYELNLMELYDREEYIIALQEDGKYTIQVPDRWETS